jgi:hypothetical protein
MRIFRGRSVEENLFLTVSSVQGIITSRSLKAEGGRKELREEGKRKGVHQSMMYL